MQSSHDLPFPQRIYHFSKQILFSCFMWTSFSILIRHTWTKDPNQRLLRLQLGCQILATYTYTATAHIHIHIYTYMYMCTDRHIRTDTYTSNHTHTHTHTHNTHAHTHIVMFIVITEHVGCFYCSSYFFFLEHFSESSSLTFLTNPINKNREDNPRPLGCDKEQRQSVRGKRAIPLKWSRYRPD